MGLLCRNMYMRSHFVCKHFASFSTRLKLNARLCSSVYVYSPNSNPILGNSRCRILIPGKVEIFLDRKLHVQEEEDDEIERSEAEQYEELVKRIFHIPEMGHQVLVIQPFIKWGPSKRRNTNPDLQLSEAVALVGTLQNWKVVEKGKVSLTSMDKKTFFGSGNLDMLRKKILKNKEITAVFISRDLLKGAQLRELEKKFGVPVYDRYMIVIQIFREHAVSREAKLQVAMAEILYLRMRLRGFSAGMTEHHSAGVAAVGGAGETAFEMRRRILNIREAKLKDKLEKLRNQRELLRNKRRKLEYPVIAVVGYTNAGKTSLIKALTGEETIVPKDHLFATLDVTAHAGYLPSHLKVLYVDTVGFISDIPANLIESFMATLEDAMQADVIIHVSDVSHPDTVAQEVTVKEMLEKLNLSSDLLENVILVGNKVDLLSKNSSLENMENHTLVSATTHEGLSELAKRIEKCVLKATGRQTLTIRVSMGGEEMTWLNRNVAVAEVKVDPESSQHAFIKVTMSKAQLGKFQHMFIQRSLR